MSGSATLTVCQRLQQADQAYMDLLSGQRVASITDENGESVRYSMANGDKLRNLIIALSTLCPSYIPMSLGSRRTPRPLQFLY